MFLSEICGLVSVGRPVWREISPWRSWRYFTTDGQSVCLGIEYPCGTCDQILFPVGMLLSEICRLVFIGRPLWREDLTAIFSIIIRWSESRRTRNHTSLSHLRLPQPWGPGSHIYIPQEQGWTLLNRLNSWTPGQLFVILHRAIVLRKKFSNAQQTRNTIYSSEEQLKDEMRLLCCVGIIASDIRHKSRVN
jgi:hypothetical protein